MNFITAFIYGLIQGLTEFLPVSSSGHLALLPHFMHIQDPGAIFDLWMHLGTALAVIVYFRKLLWGHFLVLVRARFFLKKEAVSAQELALIKNLMLSTVASFALIMLLKKFALSEGRGTGLIAFNMVVFGLLLWFSDKFATAKQKEAQLMNQRVSPKEAVLIGLAQAVAIFPGVSRSGITLTASRFLGLSREHALSYSFLLGLPVIVGGIIFEVPEYMLSIGQAGQWPYWLTGLIVSFAVGLTTIHFFLKWIGQVGVSFFVIYRLILGLLLLLV